MYGLTGCSNPCMCVQSGPGDNVRCFYCDGGLKNWKPSDEPWSEHARWFPRCPFLLTHKNPAASPIRASLTAAAAAAPASLDVAPGRRITGPADAPCRSQPGVGGQCTVEAREVKARMDSPLVQSVLDMGFQRQLVRTVIETRLKTTGEILCSDLFANLWQIQEKRQINQNEVYTAQR